MINNNSHQLVSIVIPTYNRKSDLIRAIDSVISQSYTNWELIIVDNNSIDGTIDYINSLNNSRIKLVSVSNNGLIAYSRNKGIENSNGTYIAFLDSDDWWEYNKLEMSIKYFDQDVDLVYHDLYIVKSLDQKKYRINRSLECSKSIYTDLINRGNYICNSSVVIRKKIIDRIGALPEDVEMNSICDYVAWLEISKVTNNFRKIPETLGYYWIGGGNTTNPERTIKSLIAFKHNYLNNFEYIPFWYNYSIARAFFVLKKYSEAENILSIILFQNTNLKMRMKITYMFCLSKLFKYKSIGNTN